MSQTEGGAMQGVMSMLDWFVKLAYINILWILFSIIGLGVFGMGPATVAVFNVIRQQLKAPDNKKVFSVFYKTYRREFIKGNQLFYILLSVHLFVVVDFAVIRALPFNWIVDYVVVPALIILFLLWTLMTSFSLSIFTHYDQKIRTVLKDAFWVSGIFPLSSIGILLGLFVFGIIVAFVPAVIPFYMISAPALLIQSISQQTFKTLEAKKQNQKHINS
ncbi:Uncharacterized membrane protein YesL [Pelagirhabdus alkalitolerans]|uniref:Uncharacterized membrane protein YesL n=1 Tax=Pelagirhabdus alkalitolerans TaxID=1612202 RepID=A0A1G6JZY9_9BACI|nr:DUF624 domain-containing protein [Pelagirhabdus alkalitolerans]SDC24284.1 Uncharacterized membrane protein YesL [Pelagirhabdus alkalitolerans]